MDRGVQTDVMFERSKIDDDAVQGERWHAIADRFLRSRTRLANLSPNLCQNRLNYWRMAGDVFID